MFGELKWIFVSLFLVTWVNCQEPTPCQTPTDMSGKCVRLRNCPRLASIYRSPPITPENRLLLQQSQCDLRDRVPYVCCENEITLRNVEQPKMALLPKLDECGSTSSSRIFGGEKTKIDEYPWMALVRYEDKLTKKRMFGCGGSLINLRYVLTASHCVKDKNSIPNRYNPIAVRLGEWDTSTDRDCDKDEHSDDQECVEEPVQDIDIERIISHSDYNPWKKTVHHDIALLRLKTPATTNYFVKPICLPQTQELRSMNLDNLELQAAGWGATENGTHSTVKLKVGLKIVPLAQCKTTYPRQQLWDKQLCAGGEKGMDTCKGDSGGPLMKEIKGSGGNFWILAGVVSYGNSRCGTENSPGVYTKISEYFDWILENIEQ